MEFQTAFFVRKILLELVHKLSLEELNFIPKGFNNNILWNIAHILVTEQLLTYGLTGKEITMEKDFIDRYKKGSTCLSNYLINDIETIKNKYINLINNTKSDYEKGSFNSFTSYPTSTGIILNSIDEALQFNTMHEGIHFGIILSIKKLLP